MVADPRFAPSRSDLPWLRRRHRATPKPAPTNAAATNAGVSGAAPAAGAVHDFLSGHSTAHHHPDAAPPAPALDLSRPQRPSTTPSLDLSAPSAAPPPAQAAGPSLDLDAPAQAQPSATSAPPAPRAAPTISPPGSPARRRSRPDVRVRPDERLILTPDSPTVTLTRLQSGIGTLTIEAAVSETVGDLRLGAGYELESDVESILQQTQGDRLAPAHSKRPVLVAGHDRFEHISIDLRQCRALRRLVIYAFSEGRAPLAWGGTLVITGSGGARVEVPLDSLQGGDVAALVSLYQVRGEFVLRAEMQALNGDVREVCRAYGYDKITWLDGRTPVG